MSRLDDIIGDVTYILNVLLAYKRITKTGSCNDCAQKKCEYAPGLGETVRYNCPFYEKVRSKE